jgi:hypothetical protein
MPVKLKASVRGQRGLVANLFAGVRGIEQGVRRQTLKSAVRVHQDAYRRAPVDEDVMRQLIRLQVSKAGLAFEVGYYDADFAAIGQENYGAFQELGFHHYGSGDFIRNPHIEPAFHAEDRAYRDGIRREVQLAIARMGRGRAA